MGYGRTVGGPVVETGDDRTTNRDEHVVGQIDSGDPRLSGEMWVVYSYDRYHAPGGVVPHSGIAGMDLEDGSWRGSMSGFQSLTGQHLLWHLVGEGAYEGLTAKMLWVSSGGGYDAEGVIFPGEMPPMPDLPDE